MPKVYILINYFKKFFIEKWKNDKLFWQVFQFPINFLPKIDG